MLHLYSEYGKSIYCIYTHAQCLDFKTKKMTTNDLDWLNSPCMVGKKLRNEVHFI